MIHDRMLATSDTGREPERRTGVVLMRGQERHDTGQHPESTRRLPPVIERLRGSADWGRLTVVESRPASEEDLLRSHPKAHVERVRQAVAAAPSWMDADTPVSAGSLEPALAAAGAGPAAIDAVLAEDGPDSLFALVRPPGHHAERDRAMGFCLFNNASVAARYAQAAHGVERVAIVDWDVHHGNGIQDIHRVDPSVLYVSLHQWPFYPGTGAAGEVGSGEGAGFNVNLPLPAGSGDREVAEAFDAVVEPVLESYRPGLLVVSAGQDAHAADPLGGMALSVSGFRDMAERLARLAGRLGICLVALHEGGYNLSTLPQLDHAILGGLGGFDTDLTDPHAEAARPIPGWPEALAQVRAAQRPHWPLG